MDDDELEPWEDDGADLPDEGEADGPVVVEQDEDDGAGDVTPQAGTGLFAPPAAVPPEESATPLALYRRYRPDSFGEVIGQEHVTKPLQRALENNRVNHAYLFSGPRGCGKTTSARILARALNCENGPAAEPCGHCQSCRDLATGGPGSIDVIEIDAASHGGVDDARDLRERAFFAPVSSRYKIYIIDEAHMVTTQGFNALLKLVEEPPPHVKFIFATTEPDKVIGTIRSRTHHYPFRLVPPKVLTDYLARICTEEGIATETGVLPLVVRAGGGSVRDSLSVLDQLLGGASPEGVTYEHATSLLGFTPDDLLDTMVDAFAAGDGSGVFTVVEKVIEAGQDPRRFAEDLLRRLRDLVIVAAVPDALATGLVDVTPGQAETYANEAAAMGLGELTRAADVIAEGLTQMRGTTAPRLHLELMCARVLLPGADVTERGTNARLDRIERRLNLGGLDTGLPVGEVPGAGAPAPAQRPRGGRREHTPGTAASAGPAPMAPPQPAPAAAAAIPAADGNPVVPAPVRPAAPAASQSDSAQAQGAAGQVTERPARPPRPGRPDRPDLPATPPAQEAPIPSAPVQPVPAMQPVPVPEQAPAPQPRPRADATGARALTTQDAQEHWEDILAAVGRRRHFTKVLLEGNGALVSLVGGVLTLALGSAGARTSFERPRERQTFLEALTEVFGVALQVETIIDPDAGRQGRGGRGTSGPSGPGGRTPPAGAGPAPAGSGAGRPGAAGPGAPRPTGPGGSAGQPGAGGPVVAAGTRPPSGGQQSVPAGSPTPPASTASTAPAMPPASSASPRLRGTRRGVSAAAGAPIREEVPPPPEPPEDPWDEPPPEEDPYVPRTPPHADSRPVTSAPDRDLDRPPVRAAAAPGAAPSAGPVAGPGASGPTTPSARSAVGGHSARQTPGAQSGPTSRPSRYSQVVAAPQPAKELTPEEEAAAYSDEDMTVGEGYENAAELLTNVLGAELILEEQQETGLQV
ncbi:DNA polymerase-3 subunit gamma/tau [Raineyella antarctica]|uniref:DNA-directed DNA polymerase n=1 Tax=Raineyella antarctica TaxID=1577474 RepID=A0A1G6GFM4_9ACTN|nr:DNA polymerase-3 subunit gamma/tau [Raineyella antarctica]